MHVRAGSGEVKPPAPPRTWRRKESHVATCKRVHVRMLARLQRVAPPCTACSKPIAKLRNCKSGAIKSRTPQLNEGHLSSGHRLPAAQVWDFPPPCAHTEDCNAVGEASCCAGVPFLVGRAAQRHACVCWRPCRMSGGTCATLRSEKERGFAMVPFGDGTAHPELPARSSDDKIVARGS